MTNLRRLNTTGIGLVHEWLDRLGTEGTGNVPAELLNDVGLSDPVDRNLQVDGQTFASRLHWGRYIEEVLRDLPTRAIQVDSGLWVWLTLFYFDQVCPAGSDGKRKVGQRARYIPSSTNYRTYYRHLLQGPWRIVRAHRENPERALGVLAGPLYRPGEIAEQLASRQELVTSGTVMECATTLYVDTETGTIKQGAGGAGRGSPRRLADILAQFDMTYDIYNMSAAGLLGMLPPEFNRFLPAPPS